MKFKKGDKVIYYKHTKPTFTNETEDAKHFEIGKVYEIERIASDQEKTYTLKDTKTYVFESQLLER